MWACCINKVLGMIKTTLSCSIRLEMSDKKVFNCNFNELQNIQIKSLDLSTDCRLSKSHADI